MNNYTYKHKNVDTIDFCCIDHFIEEIVEELCDAEEEFVSTSIIANGEFTHDLIKILLSDENDFDMYIVNFDAEDYCGEYIVTITNDFKLFCEPMYRDNKYGEGYLTAESDYVYLLEDSNFKILDSITSDKIIIFGFGDED